MLIKKLMTRSFSLTALAVLMLMLGLTGCGEQPSAADVARKAAAEEKVPIVNGANFDDLVLKGERPVLIWFFDIHNSLYSDQQHEIMESVVDHY